MCFLSGTTATSPSDPCMKSIFRLLIASLSVFPAGGTAMAAPEYVEGEVIITFKEGVDQASARKNLRGRAMDFHKHFSALSRQQRKQVGVLRSKTKTTARLIQELRNDPEIERVEPNHLYRQDGGAGTPDDALFPHLWALRNSGQRINGIESAPGSDIGFIPASILAQPTTVEPVVAVIDSGITLDHPDLVANLWVNGGEIPGNGIDDDGNGFVDDVHGMNFLPEIPVALEGSVAGYHGTHVSGTIAATGHNGAGVIGANPAVRIMSLKVGDDGGFWPTSSIIAALDYVVLMKSLGVNIVAINGSYGGGDFNVAHRDAIDAAGQAGIIFCGSAGNDAANNDATPKYPASYRLPNMIVVASSNHQDGLSSFSNYGATTVDLAAPGSEILSTMPDGLGLLLHVDDSLYVASAMAFSGRGDASGRLVDCGSGFAGQFPPGVNGNIALIERGVTTFAEKTANAMAAGATAVVVYDNVVSDGLPSVTLNAGEWVPTVIIRRVHGLAVLESVQTRNVEASLSLAEGPSYGFMSGTSMAAPQVSAAVAFAAMHFPDDAVGQRIARILDHVDVRPAFVGKTITGGRLNLQRLVDPNALNNYAHTIWSGGGGANTDINLNTNWAGGVTNSLNGTSFAFFHSASAKATINVDVCFQGIDIQSSSHFEIADGPGNLTIGSGGIRSVRTQTTPGPLVYAINESHLILGSNQIWDLHDPTGSPFQVSSAISGSGYGIIKTNVGTLRLSGSGANTYSGITTIREGMVELAKSGASAIAGDLIIGDNGATPGLDILRLSGTGGNQIADTSNLAFLGSGADAGVFHLNGRSETVGGLASKNGEGIVENNAHGLATLTLAVNDSKRTYSGIIRDGASGTVALVKTGNGRQALTGTLSYTGNTTVGNGELVLSAPSIADGSTVTIGSAGSASGVLNLNHPATDLVAALFIHGEAMPAGIHDATNTAGAIAGAGKIEVVASGYNTWLAENPGLHDNSPGADPDNDGIANLMEFVLNGDPTRHDPSILPAAEIIGGEFVFTFLRRGDSIGEVDLVFQSSPDLESWTDVPIPQQAAAPVDFGAVADGMQPVTITLPIDALATKFFARLMAVD